MDAAGWHWAFYAFRELGEFGQDPQYLGLVVAWRDRGDRVSPARQVPHARQGEQAANPGAQREADHSERGAFVGTETVPEHLLETGGDALLVIGRARPHRRRMSGQ